MALNPTFSTQAIQLTSSTTDQVQESQDNYLNLLLNDHTFVSFNLLAAASDLCCLSIVYQV